MTTLWRWFTTLFKTTPIDPASTAQRQEADAEAAEARRTLANVPPYPHAGP